LAVETGFAVIHHYEAFTAFFSVVDICGGCFNPTGIVDKGSLGGLGDQTKGQ